MALQEVDPSLVDDDVPPVGTFTPGAEPSVVDLLRQELKELSDIEEVHIPVTGYEKTGLTVKYRLPESGKELDLIAQKVLREYKDMFSRNLNIATDTMVHLCVGLYVNPTYVETDEPIMLDPEELGHPVRFDPRLAAILGVENPETATARSVIRKLFDNNDIAIVSHADKLGRWLGNTKADMNTEFWQLGG